MFQGKTNEQKSKRNFTNLKSKKYNYENEFKQGIFYSYIRLIRNSFPRFNAPYSKEYSPP